MCLNEIKGGQLCALGSYSVNKIYINYKAQNIQLWETIKLALSFPFDSLLALAFPDMQRGKLRFGKEENFTNEDLFQKFFFF